MACNQKRSRIIASITLVMSFTAIVHAVPAFAEDGILRLHVTNPAGKAIDGVTLGPNGVGTPGKTKDGGRASIQLPSQVKEFAAIKLQIIGGPGTLDFVSPWDHVVVIPSFANDPANYAEIVLAPHGAVSMLQHDRSVRALASAITYGASTGKASDQPGSGSRQSRLELVARDYGLDPNALDKAIREWGQHAHTAEDRALAKMYAQQYEAAAVDFAEAIREQNEIEQRARLKKAELLAESGLNLYLAGKPSEASTAYQDSFRINPDDPTMLNNYALVLKLLGDNDKASDKFQRALVAGQRLWGNEDLQVVPIMNNVAQSFLTAGKSDEAIDEFQKGLQIRKAKLASDDVHIAMSLTDIGAIYASLDRCPEATPLLNQALTIFQSNLAGPPPSQLPERALVVPQKTLVIPEERQQSQEHQQQQQQMTIPTRREKKETEARDREVDEKIRQQRESQAKDRFDAGQPSISVVYLSLALCTDEIDSRKQLLRSALREAEAQFGEGHLETTYSMVALGRFLRDHGTQSERGRRRAAVDEKAEGMDLLNKALAIRASKLGPENELTASLKKELDDAHQ
jgi:tetratricopeptide (TPR) repeat protein